MKYITIGAVTYTQLCLLNKINVKILYKIRKDSNIKSVSILDMG